MSTPTGALLRALVFALGIGLMAPPSPAVAAADESDEDDGPDPGLSSAFPEAPQDPHQAEPPPPKKAPPAAPPARSPPPPPAAAPASEPAAAPAPDLDLVAEPDGPPIEDRTITTLFDRGLAAFYAKEYQRAAGLFSQMLGKATPLTENLGWAQFFLGQSLEALELPYAAEVYYYLIAKTRSQPEVIADALERLRAMSFTDSYDDDLIGQELLYDGDFGVLKPELSGWVAYHKGLEDARLGFDGWSERHFRGIDRRTSWAPEADYVRGVVATRDHRDDDAVELFTAVRHHPEARPEARKRADLALARLAFERGHFVQAVATYDTISQARLTFEEAQILAEKAWVHYHAKNYAQALGLLHALASPAYAHYFFPETYLLRALIYKDLCHYLAAKSSVRAFRARFGRVFEQLKARVPVGRIETLRLAATTGSSLAPRTRLLHSLRRQSAHLAKMAIAKGPLGAELRALYAAAMDTHERRWQRQFDGVADNIARDLLDTQEQMGILDYEVSLDIFRPLGERLLTPVRTQPQPHPRGGAAFYDYYLFDGEYWNPELDHYRVFITSRCFEEVVE